MPEQQITDMPTRAAPNSRLTKQSETFELLAVNATFNGAAAVSAFLPAVEVVSDSGVVVARHVADDTVAAGGSAAVTFAPFLRNKRGDIRFGRGNTGNWLVVHTTGTAPSPPAFTTGDGVEIIAQNAGIFMEGSFISLDSDADFILEADRDFDLDVRRDETHIVTRFVEFNAESFFVDVTQDVAINPTRIAFFGVGPVAQQPTPVTLANVIALLQAYGLAA